MQIKVEDNVEQKLESKGNQDAWTFSVSALLLVP